MLNMEQSKGCAKYVERAKKADEIMNPIESGSSPTNQN